jgi:hypothetical protein
MSGLLGAYADYGLRVFPCRADKKPLVPHWRDDATCDDATIQAWLRQWPYADWAWAVTATVVVVDIDVKGGKNGYRDFERLDGHDPRTVGAPAATTPSGGMQIFYAAAKLYKNRVAIGGTGIDTRTEGGYVLLPLPDNGREWLRPLLAAVLPPAPAWLDCALRQESTRSTAAALKSVSLSDDPQMRQGARMALARACTKIISAPVGQRDDTLNTETFLVGALVRRGVLSFAEAHAALVTAARAMPTFRRDHPHCDLGKKIGNSLQAGVERAR